MGASTGVGASTTAGGAGTVAVVPAAGAVEGGGVSEPQPARAVQAQRPSEETASDRARRVFMVVPDSQQVMSRRGAENRPSGDRAFGPSRAPDILAVGPILTTPVHSG